MMLTFPILTFTLCALLTVSSTALASEPLPDTPFNQEYHEAYPLLTPGENDVRAIAVDMHGRVWAGTAEGLRFLENGVWKTPDGGRDTGLVHTLTRDSDGVIWVGAWNGLWKIEGNRITSAGLEGSPIGAIRAAPAGSGHKASLYVGGPAGIWRRQGSAWQKIEGLWQTTIRALLPLDDEHLWIATASGLYLQSLTVPADSKHLSRPEVLLSSNVTAFAPLPDGTFWIGGTGGLDLYRGDRRLRSLTPKEGLPCRQLRSLALDQRGRLWMASRIGVIRYEGGRFHLRHSRRWLQSDDVRDVAIGPDGAAWIATSAGVDAIRSRKMTLSEKADYFLKMVRARHIRPPGLVGPAVLEHAGDLSKSFIEDDDNDGEHTGMYCALESMRYAVTHDPQARQNARDAFHALQALQQITGTRHFIARSMLPLETPPRHEVDRTFTPEELSEMRRTDPRGKPIEKRWVPSADGKWLWKRDASSDEVDGHMFGYSVYFDLAADELERKLVADQVDRIIGGILNHGYLLQDIDGKGTQWGNWSPASLNGDRNWNEERPGNSVELLSYLGVAYHMTGKERYRETARELVQKHGYERNMLDTRFDTPSERTHIEDELLSMIYPNLLNHLVLPELKRSALTSLSRWHKTCAKDEIPFYDFVYRHFSGKEISLEGSMRTLREWPLDLIEWTVDNSAREDVDRDLTPGLDEGRLSRILPRAEMGICMWDQEPYKVSIGNNGAREDKPCDWLLAYWMGRYWGLISGADSSRP